jgi:hypothetical protein
VIHVKTRIGSILIAATLVSCAEPAATTAPLVESGGSHRYIEGPQEIPPGVPPEYDVPTTVDAVAGAGAISIATGKYAYGQSAVNYTATTGLAKVRLEIDGYPDALGEAQNSSLLPLSNGVTATAARNITETCGKSLRAEAYGAAWNEFVGLSVLSWGRVSDSDMYPYALSACQVTQPPSSRYVQEPDEFGCQVYVVEQLIGGVWVEIDRFSVCPDENTGFYSRRQVESPFGATSKVRATGTLQQLNAASAAGSRSVGRAATIQFIGTGFMDARTHLTIHPGARQADAIVLVDTMRASPEDVEAALMAINQLSNVLTDGVRIDVAKHVLKGQSSARAAERAAPLLAAIKQSRATSRAQGYVGRSLKVSVLLPATREGERRR